MKAQIYLYLPNNHHRFHRHHQRIRREKKTTKNIKVEKKCAYLYCSKSKQTVECINKAIV